MISITFIKKNKNKFHISSFDLKTTVCYKMILSLKWFGTDWQQNIYWVVQFSLFQYTFSKSSHLSLLALFHCFVNFNRFLNFLRKGLSKYRRCHFNYLRTLQCKVNSKDNYSNWKVIPTDNPSKYFKNVRNEVF